ncbi:MAG: methyltransferase domain-containing protein [Anaerolineae bacterium]|nr:methyltransferase domain-containing protein [Anaerolineae bacterium]
MEEWQDVEIEVLPGLESIVEEELAGLMASRRHVIGRPAPGRIAVRILGEPWILERLRCAVAVHLLARFDVPRPRALLGHQHFTRLAALLSSIVSRQPRGAFASVRISAAGSGSSVFIRLKEELERALGLAATGGEGDLLVSVRRPADGSPGWEVLARTTPRPLSARAWRVCSMPGALNATIAHAMIRLAGPRRHDRFLNLACGSGTLLVERLEHLPARFALGVDASAGAIECAEANLRASGHLAQVALIRGDVTRVPLASGSVDTMVVDLPYGMLVGSSEENRQLYPALLREAARLAAPRAVLVAVTAATRVFRSALQQEGGAWFLDRVVPVRIPYRDRQMTANIYLLRRE